MFTYQHSHGGTALTSIGMTIVTRRIPTTLKTGSLRDQGKRHGLARWTAAVGLRMRPWLAVSKAFDAVLLVSGNFAGERQAWVETQVSN